MYTSLTQDEYETDLRRRYSAAVINYISAALFIGMVGIIYHQTGFQAVERERGIATLIEAMGGSKTSRFLSYIYAFSIMYVSGWIVMAITLWGGIFKNTSIAIVLVWHLLSGVGLSSWSLFIGSIFKKAQLSGISTTVFSLILGIIAQVTKDSGTGAQAVLSFLFPPMNYVYFSISLGRAEKEGMGAPFAGEPRGGNSKLPLIAYFIFMIIHIVAFPFLAALIENYLYGTKSPGHRHINSSSMNVANAVELQGFTKRYPPRLLTKLFGKHKEDVVAVDNLDLSVLRGQIMVLLGANGSGKTTTLEAIAGLSNVKEGNISVNTAADTAGIGICPQKNVLWDDLTVFEHLRIWSGIKAQAVPDTRMQLKELLDECDLGMKRHAKSKTLSGGQKRKLQLAIMFTGGSSVCAIDEVSSGLDPLSRRKIWDIVLAARGTRTILMTSHYLDEADLLADHIAILSKGKLKCEGSAVQLKTELGGGYRVHAPLTAPAFDGVPTKRLYDQTIYNVPTSADAAALTDALEKREILDYYVAGPTIEDVFLKVAEESVANRSENTGEKDASAQVSEQAISTTNSSEETKGGVKLYDGRNVPLWKQTWFLIRKRFTILQRGYLPTIGAILIPIIAAGITMVTFKDFEGVSCDPARQINIGDIENFTFDVDFDVVVGPPSIQPDLASFASESLSGTGLDLEDIQDMIHTVTSRDAFIDYIDKEFHNVTPGGFFIDGDNKAVYAYKGDDEQIRGALTIQNFVNNLLLDVPGGITTQYLAFDTIWPKDQGTTLIFITYCGLAFGAFPAFFALYPTIERLRNVRALHYSNGVRALPLWLAYTLFDFLASLIICVISIIIFAAATSGWYGLGYLFAVLVLYCLASIMLSYMVSLITKSQLSAFAFVAGGQAVMFLVYFIAYMSVLTYSAPEDQTSHLNIVHFVISAISPVASLTRAFFVALNSFSIDCDDDVLKSYPGEIGLYGGPILYLALQTIILFAILVLRDSGYLRIPSFRNKLPKDAEDRTTSVEEVTAELARMTSGTDDPLQIISLSKTFKKNTAVDDITFGVPSNEIFALLGPNGAGKTTTINMIRGDLPPTAGRILVQSHNVTTSRAAARSHLGVCPQFDAMDRMTVTEHLIFYARIRGVTNISHNVTETIRAVGLEEFQHRLAEKLSGGNKRKLSLAIALMGNPSVLLLDEPSSGMDAASKRIMWRTLESVAPGRSVILTTHSMEECSALATRAGILAKRMLALGTTEQLRRRHGNKYLVHLVLASAPNSTAEEMAVLTNWVKGAFVGPEMEERSFGGQVRFSIPGGTGGVAGVFEKLEREARGVGAKFWSVDRGTMDMVFLEVVGNASIKEEGYEEGARKKWAKMLMFWKK